VRASMRADLMASPVSGASLTPSPEVSFVQFLWVNAMHRSSLEPGLLMDPMIAWFAGCRSNRASHWYPPQHGQLREG